MKKILILAYDFPPYVSVGGLRPYSWYKYFKEYDIEPIVITRQWSNTYKNHLDYIAAGESNEVITEKTEYGNIIKTPYKPNWANRLMLNYGEHKFKIVRKIISAYFEFMQWFFIIGPKSNIYKAANNYLKNNKVDAIIATGDPFILFKYASKLSKKHNIPWIADYRDPWSQNFENQRNFYLRKFSSYFEKKSLENAFLIITVSDFVKKQISILIKNKKFEIIPNGFNPEFINQTTKIKQNKTILNIGFVGTIYKWHPIISFINTITCFIKNADAKIIVNFYGTNINNELTEIINNQYTVFNSNFIIHPKLPNDVLLEELASNNLLLLFNYYSYMGTKIYDYIGINRSILFCYSNDKEASLLKEKYYTIKEEDDYCQHLQEDLINETQSGYVAHDAAHLYTLLEQLYAEFCEKGYVECNTINAEKYSRKYQVERLAEMVKNL